MIEVSSNNISTTGPDSDCDEPQTTINVCLHRETHARLTAYKNFNPLASKTFDEAINEALDAISFPEADAFENPTFPALSYTGDGELSIPTDE